MKVREKEKKGGSRREGRVEGGKGRKSHLKLREQRGRRGRSWGRRKRLKDAEGAGTGKGRDERGRGKRRTLRGGGTERKWK